MSSLKVPVTSADHSGGPENAPLTLVEYGDYQCPGCGQAYPIAKQIQKHFGKRLRFVFRNFPLNESHPEAESAAETAEFAGAQGKFWQMHDALYENQDQLGLELYRTLAKEFGLSEPDLDASLTAGTYRGRVRADFSSGVHSGVNATPTFYINGIRHDASFDFETLSAALQHAVAAPTPAPDAHAILVLDQAGWHTTGKLKKPANIIFPPLPPKSPELNPAENVREYLRGRWLSNRIFKDYDAILDAVCDAWNRLIDEPARVASIGKRTWPTTGLA